MLRLSDYHSSASRPSKPKVSQGTQRLLDGKTDLPAYARHARYDLVAMNALGAAMMPGVHTMNGETANLARYVFLDPDAQTFYADWEEIARDMVAALRIEGGRTPFDKWLTDLIGELSTRSDAFRTWWVSHNVRLHNSSTKSFHNPTDGEIEVTDEAMELASKPGVTFIAHTVEPRSVSEERLRLLSSWMRRQPRRHGLLRSRRIDPAPILECGTA